MSHPLRALSFVAPSVLMKVDCRTLLVVYWNVMKRKKQRNRRQAAAPSPSLRSTPARRSNRRHPSTLVLVTAEAKRLSLVRDGRDYSRGGSLGIMSDALVRGLP